MLSTYSTIIGFFYLFSLASATGHLRLELTSSDSLAVHLQTYISAQTIFLEMGTTRIVSFHPKVDQESLEVAFSQQSGPSQFYVYNLNAAGVKTQQTMVFSNVVLLVQSFFECDDGFIGDTCRETSTTSTETTTTTPAKTTTPETLTTTTPRITTSASEDAPTPSAHSSVSTIFNNPPIYNIILIVVVVVLLMLIVIVYLSHRTRQPHTYIEPATPSKQYRDDSGIYSPQSSTWTNSSYAEV